jgi:hypothetical protein
VVLVVTRSQSSMLQRPARDWSATADCPRACPEPSRAESRDEGTADSALPRGALAELDEVDDRLVLAARRTRRERQIGVWLTAQLAMLERLDEHAHSARLTRASEQARLRLHRRIGDLVHLQGLLLAEHHAHVDAAREHLRSGRRAARIDSYLVGRAGGALVALGGAA